MRRRYRCGSCYACKYLGLETTFFSICAYTGCFITLDVYVRPNKTTKMWVENTFSANHDIKEP